MWGANSKKAAPRLTGTIDNHKCHCFFCPIVQGVLFGSWVLGTPYMLNFSCGIFEAFLGFITLGLEVWSLAIASNDIINCLINFHKQFKCQFPAVVNKTEMFQLFLQIPSMILLHQTSGW